MYWDQDQTILTGSGKIHKQQESIWYRTWCTLPRPRWRYHIGVGKFELSSYPMRIIKSSLRKVKHFRPKQRKAAEPQCSQKDEKRLPSIIQIPSEYDSRISWVDRLKQSSAKWNPKNIWSQGASVLIGLDFSPFLWKPTDLFNGHFI